MRGIFQRWLLIFVAFTFVVTFSISFVTQTKLAQDSAINLIRIKIFDAEEQLSLNKKNLDIIRKENDAEILNQVRTFAKFVELNPNILENQEELESYRKLLKADVLYAINKDGIVFASTNPDILGFDMNTSAQSQDFLPLLKDKSLEIVQNPMPMSYDNNSIMQHAGVPLKNMEGFVQVAYLPEHLQEALDLADIKNFAPGFRIGTNGKILIAKDNIILSTNSKEFIGKKLDIYGINPSHIRGKSGTLFANIRGEDKMCAYDNWEGLTIIGCMPTSEIYMSRNDMAWQLIVFNILLFLIVFVVISLLVQKIVINGIYAVNRSLQKITEGDLEEKVNLNSNKEFISLSSGINKMVNTLKQAIAEAKARIDAELKYARDIQYSAVPSVFPPFPDRKEIDVYANMTTAKEVGGDFYDFFFVDDRHLAFIIADVSGKSIPAALFMMTAKALIKSYATTGISAGEVFTLANNRLCENNDTGMFVTAFMGILDVVSGTLTYVNAGHNPPLIYNAEQGKFSYMKIASQIILGYMPDYIFKQYELTLNKGDLIYLYTDGVTEAQNANKELYGSARLEKLLNTQPSNLSSENLIEKVKEDVNKFSENADEAFDDMTMVAVRYNGNDFNLKKNMPGLYLDATIDNLKEVMKFISDSLDYCECSTQEKKRVQLAVEEIYVNIASYAYTPDIGKVKIDCEITKKPKTVTITFTDKGKPYNPFSKNDPDIDEKISERSVGGLGVFVVKKIMDNVSYSYKDGQNILAISKLLG